jgi:Undecaprenyl-phosphate glucose phosphotransferase
MSEVARQDFSPLVIGTPAEPGGTAVLLPSVFVKRPNLVAMAAVACVIESAAVIAAFWVSCAICGSLLVEFHAPQSWFGVLVCALMIASIAERGDYGAGVMLDCGLRPWSLAKASLQTAGAVLLLASPWILATQTVLSGAATPLPIAGTGPATLIALMVAFVSASYLTVLSVRLVGRIATAPLARPRRVIVVGEPERCASLIGALHQVPRRSMKILGVIDPAIESQQLGGAVPLARQYGLSVLGRLDELKDMVQQGKVDVVIVALPWSEAANIREIIGSVGGAPVDVLLAPDLGLFDLPATPATEFARVPLLRAIYPPLVGWKAFVKRAEDIVVAGSITLLAAPAILTIAALIKLTSRGPVFFRQQRFGYNGQIFEAYKFRTMYTHLADKSGAEQTKRGDARITPFGAWLRRRSLDELPQLFNILRGDMSLVGPRPHPVGMTARGMPLDQAAPEYRMRQRVRPGLTGWAQVNGNRGPLHTCSDVIDRVTLDLEYIRDWSLAFDLKIIWLTLGLLVNDKNAY